MELRTSARHAIQDEIVQILTDMTQDWDLDLSDGISGSTRLMADLACESMDIVMLIVAIEERFSRKGLPFEKLLMEEDRYISELSVDEVTDFLVRELSEHGGTRA